MCVVSEHSGLGDEALSHIVKKNYVVRKLVKRRKRAADTAVGHRHPKTECWEREFMECLAGPPGLQDVSDDDADDADDDIDPALCDILPVEPVSGQSHASALQAGDDVDDGIAGAVRSSEGVGLAGGSKHASKSRGEVELKRITIEKDNNCLFNAIAYLCSHQGTQVSAAVLRKWIADGIQGNPESYTQAGLGIPPNEYCEWIQDERLDEDTGFMRSR